MNSSTAMHWLSLINREPSIGRMALGLLFGVMTAPWAILVAAHLPFILDGETVDARVVAGPTDVRTNMGFRHLVRFAYTDAIGEQHTGEQTLRKTKLRVGDPVVVRYVRSTPERSKVESSMLDHVPALFFASLGLVVVVASVWHGLGGIRQVNDQIWPEPTQASVASHNLEQSDQRESE